MRTKVAILGGGVAGMSAAHELCERGFQVEVYERRNGPGGKARSVRVQPPSTGFVGGSGARRAWLPGEHGFRFFPGFYRHVIDTMQRIPFRTGSVADNLVNTTEIHIARYDQPRLIVPARYPMSLEELKTALMFALSMIGGRLNVPFAETTFFASKLWQLISSCEARRLGEYERIDWWSFIDAERRSPAYRSVYGHGITRSLVAAKAERANTKTIGDVFLQMLLSMLNPETSADRVLNGPTNEVWIDPWLDHLGSNGVAYHTECEVTALNVERGTIRSASVRVGANTRDIHADYFIAALPVERMALLVTPALAALDPALGMLGELSKYVEWMNGIQFYLDEDVPIAHGHSIYLDSPWALTSVSQAQFWPDYPARSFGQGDIGGILSVDISAWDVPGSHGKTAQQSTREEIRDEVWRQLKRSLNTAGETVLRDESLRFWVLDSDITDNPKLPGFETNAEPLLVNYVDTWRLRPDAQTRIPNLQLASDYVRTFTDLATMEAANEAARRAVNGVLKASGSTATACELWNLHEPELLQPLRQYDALRHARGMPWDCSLVDWLPDYTRAANPAAASPASRRGLRVRIVPG